MTDSLLLDAIENALDLLNNSKTEYPAYFSIGGMNYRVDSEYSTPVVLGEYNDGR